MATIVCQGLQSCLESHLVEPRTLRLRLSSPPRPLELNFQSSILDSNTKPSEEKCHSEESLQQIPDNDADPGSWSFLEAITNGCQLEAKSDKDQNKTYVHPLSKRSSSTLSDKSLELCTENLGSETGTDIVEDIMFSLSDSSSSSDSESGNFQTREQKKSSRQLLGRKKASSSTCRSFPPPLTTISGLESLQMRTHREDGRLLIKAVKAPSRHSLFQAERSHGRLRLSIFKDSPPLFDSEEKPEEEEEEGEEEEEEEEEGEMAQDETTLGDDSTQDFEKEEEQTIHENNRNLKGEEEGKEDDDENVAYREEEMDGKNTEVGGEKGIMKKYKRAGRCKEDESGAEKKNIGRLSWEPLWVATS